MGFTDTDQQVAPPCASNDSGTREVVTPGHRLFDILFAETLKRHPSMEHNEWGTQSEEAEKGRAIFEATAEAFQADMLAALKDCLGWHDFADDLHKPIEVRAAYMRARAAIAKATGGTMTAQTDTAAEASREPDEAVKP